MMAKDFRSVSVLLFLVISLGGGVLAESSHAETIPLSKLQQVTHFHGIAVDPKDPSRIYLATHHGFFVVTADGVATRVSEKKNDFMGFTTHPTDPSVLYASGHPAGGGNLGFIISSDGGKTWQQVAKGVNGPVDFHQMDVSKADAKTIYGVFFGGLQVSKDSGRTWQLAAKMPEGLIDLAASATDVNRLYAATKRGLLASDDGGATWQPAYIPGEPTTMVTTAADGVVYVFVLGKGLIRGTEPSLRWKTLSNDFGGRYILHMAIDPINIDNLYVVTQKRQVLASKDGGRTWAVFGAR
jgi:photosystem II stability/assembly factor-like uncharacterized protein